MALKKEKELRKRVHEHMMKKFVRVNKEEFIIGDLVRLQNIKSRKWTVKGNVEERREAKDGSTKSYLVRGEEGRTFLRNGRFIRVRRSRVKSKSGMGEKKVRFSLKLSLSQASQLAAGRQLAGLSKKKTLYGQLLGQHCRRGIK